MDTAPVMVWPPLPLADLARVRLAQIVLAAVVGCSSLYFFTGRGWNQAAHFDLVRAILEQGTFRIDAYHENTGDKIQYDGHYYSNKAPGTAFLATPFVAAARVMIRAAGGDPTSERSLQAQMRVAGLVCGMVPTIAAALSLLFIALRLGATVPAALLAALAFAMGTPVWLYSTFFWAHPLTAGSLAVSLAAAVALAESGSTRRDLALGAVVGTTAGWAVLSEYPAAAGAILLALFAIWQGRGEGRRRLLTIASGVAAGAVPTSAILFGYHAIAFGSPFSLSYGTVVAHGGHALELYGLAFPRRDVLLELLFGSYRGLFILAPALAAAVCGVGALFRSSGHRVLAAVALLTFLAFLSVNASFYYWWAGWCVGPRYLTGAIPFLSLGFIPLLRNGGPPARAAVVALAAVGMLLNLAVLATDTMPDDAVKSPVWGLAVPAFVAGTFSRSPDSFNLGEVVGLEGHASLVPLVGFWILLGLIWLRQDRRIRPAAGVST